MNDPDIMTNAPKPPVPLSRAQVVAFLEYQLSALIARRDDEVLPALQAMLTHAVTSDAVAGTYAENIRIGAALQKAIEDDVMRAKRPFMDADKAAIGWRASATKELSALLGDARLDLLGWEQKKIAAAREAARQRSEEAAARAAEARAASDRSVAAEGLWGSTAAQHEAIAAAAQETADKASDLAVGKANKLGTGTIGQYGARVSVRTTWDYRMVDWDAVPIEFKQLNDDAVKAAMRERDPATGRPVREIPGIEWFSQETLGGIR